MKKQGTILIKLNILWRAACWCALVVGLTLACGAAFAELIPIILKHDSRARSVAFSPDGRLLATAGSWGNTAKVWEMPSGKLIATIRHDSGVGSVTFSPDEKLLATGSSDKTAKVWEMPSGNMIATMRHDDAVWSVTFSPDGKLLATGSSDKTAKVWEMPSGNMIATLKHEGYVSSVVFSPDGKLLATASNLWDDKLKKYTINEAKVWEMPSGKLIATMRHDGDVYSVTFSPDGRLLATGSSDKTAKVWEMPPGKLIATMEHDNPVYSVTFSPDGKLLATGSWDKTAKVWEMLSGKLIATMRHGGDVYSVTFSPDGKLLATGSSDKTAKVWEMPSGKLIATLKHDDDVWSVSFSPDGKMLVTGSDDDTAKVWVPNTADIPTLTQPPNGAEFVDALPELKWDKVPNALLYQAQVAKDKDFSQMALETTTGAESLKVGIGQLAAGEYFWRVRTVGWSDFGKWSGVRTFKLTMPAPALSAPVNGIVLADTLTPTLKWEASKGASSYGVQIATDEQFKTVVIEQSNIKATELVVLSGKLSPGKYFWRANATGVFGTGDWSRPWSFTVDAVNILRAPVITVTQVDATFDISIEKARNLYGFQFDLQFNPDVLEAVKVTEGDFLKSIGGNTSFLKPSIDNSKGIIKNVVASRMSPGEVDGAGVLATIHFRFKQARTSPITFTLVKLSNEQFQPIPFAYVDGSITLKTEASAKFIVQPSIVNNQVVAKILIKDAVNLRGYSVDLEHPSALELLEVKQGDFLPDGWQQTTPYVNTIRFSASKTERESVEGSGEIATLTFSIWEGGEQLFTLTNGTLTAPVVTTIYTPELQSSAITVVASPNWEVNKDYVVDMQDIVILGINFDKKITGNPRPNPDVTRNVLVDLFDLVAVASHYADEYSAVPQPPAAPGNAKSKLTVCSTPTPAERAILQNLYDKVSRYPDTDASVLAVKRLLASLFGYIEPALPQRTRLAQNYPNPFNPETWIPFELSEAADVTIEIYDAKGQLVHTLALGQKPAGFYLTRNRAAYWNGRNDSGEQVASGVYFYTLTAGKFTATKKFVVLR